jgi:putative ABC transport system permease protein
MEQLVQDLRYSLRAMRRDAGFCVVAVLILGIGIGANTAIFSVVNTVLFRPLPFQDPARLVWIANAFPGSGLSGVTSRVSNYRDFQKLNHSFESLTAYFAFSDYGSYTLTESGEPERLIGFGVAKNFFDVLGVRPMLGRPFDDEECKWNGRKAVILSQRLWERRFNSDPHIVGRSITLNGAPTLVAGVLPDSFDFASVFTPGAKVDMLTPFPITDETDRWGNTLAIIGRLKPDSNVRQAQAEFDVLLDQMKKAHPERFRFGARLTGLQEQVSGRFHKALIVLLCAVGAVLLIACANLSNLLLARAASRRKEIAVRTALGASRGRLIRQMLTESMLLSCCGAIAGLVLAYAATRALAGLQAMSIPLLAAAHVDGLALGFTVAVTIITGILFGLAPALQISNADVHESIKDNARGSSEGRRGAWMRNSLVVGEVAVACVLLVGAGLLMRSFVRVMDVDLGFQPARTAIWTIEPGQKYRTGAQKVAMYQELVRRVDGVPGVETAGITDCLPLGRNRSWGLRAKGVQYPDGQAPLAFPRIVDPGYIPAMKIPLRAGRGFTDHDTAQSELVMIINENAARRLWPDRDPVGQIALAGRGEARVIGVVANVRHSSLEQDAGLEMYFPITQSEQGSVELVVRTKRSAEAIAPDIRTAMRGVEPSLPTAEFRTLDDVVDRAVSPRKFVVLLLGGFAALALALAALGIYGVVSYSVTQRTQEIGIRMALGASAGHVQLRVLRETVTLALAGAAIGVVASVAVSRLIASLLFGVQPGDTVTFAAMLCVLTLVAAFAGYLPARRASRIDPMSALRAE